MSAEGLFIRIRSSIFCCDHHDADTGYWCSDVSMVQHGGDTALLSIFYSSSSQQIAKWGTKSNCRLFPIILRASAHKEGIFNLLLGPRLSRTNKVPAHLLFRSRPTRTEQSNHWNYRFWVGVASTCTARPLAEGFISPSFLRSRGQSAFPGGRKIKQQKKANLYVGR